MRSRSHAAVGRVFYENGQHIFPGKELEQAAEEYTDRLAEEAFRTMGSKS